MPTRIFIVAAKRTAFGAFGGKLMQLSSTDLCVHATKAALSAGGISPSVVDTVVVGNVAQTSIDAPYVARHVALKAGMEIDTPALNVNRLCGSGFQSVVSVAQEILLGEAELGVAAGTESMSQAPMSIYGHNVRFGTKLGADLRQVDTLWASLTDTHGGCAMGVTAENLASDHGITRQMSDEYALQSQTRYQEAKAKGIFASEICPISLKTKKGEEVFDADEHPRPTSLEKMAKLSPTFKKDGVVTAAAASGICDGAGALVLASGEAVSKYGLTPLAELVSYASVGVDPTRMGIGPVPAIKKALAKAGMSIGEVDLVDINEAFAPQFLACAKELGLDMAKTNVCGGAIALGHPLGASGSRITAHLAHAIAEGRAKTAVGSACIGGGQGIAVVLKAC
ncbi:hypothetical protein AB1Y20_002845 [Prymnesium parvum]|uniref:Uncharacterized protein n=1 Tax=Prymnesium parvum TaxID=97485 RepID=A0AB34JAB4_PRYPA